MLFSDGFVITVDGHQCNLDSLHDVKHAEDIIHKCLMNLRSGDLDEYEDKSMECGCGGRSELLYDRLMVKMAHDRIDGKHSLTATEMHMEAKRIVGIQASQAQARGFI